MKKITLAITAELMTQMGLTDGADEMAVANAIKNLTIKAGRVDSLQTNLTTAQERVTELEKEANELKTAGNKAAIKAHLDKALDDKKITVAMSQQLATDYAANPDGLKKLLEGMGGYTSVVDEIQGAEKGKESLTAYNGKSWDDIMDSGKMDEFKQNHPAAYKALYKKEFGEDPK